MPLSGRGVSSPSTPTSNLTRSTPALMPEMHQQLHVLSVPGTPVSVAGVTTTSNMTRPTLRQFLMPEGQQQQQQQQRAVSMPSTPAVAIEVPPTANTTTRYTPPWQQRQQHGVSVTSTSTVITGVSTMSHPTSRQAHEFPNAVSTPSTEVVLENMPSLNLTLDAEAACIDHTASGCE